jgi:ABC-type sugar transport system ATPase subunit
MSSNVRAASGRPRVETVDQTTLPVLLDMRGITKDFASGRVLHGIDFRLRAGEVHALVGENGAGKSTLMKILAGLYPDHGGTIELDGRLVAMRSPRGALDQGIAVIYQEFALAPDLTVAENIALGREPSLGAVGMISHRNISRQSAEEAKALGIDLPMDTPVAEISVADQQLTEIVKAVARQARVLVMDEPTARLSSNERGRLFEIIRRLSARGVGIVYISHFLEEIFSVASKATVLRDGRRVACEPLDRLDLTRLSHLMVGEKFREIEMDTRSRLADGGGKPEEALVVDQLAVDGVVEPITFRLHRGEVIGLAGLQGSGRTALANAIVGKDRAKRRGQIRTRRFTGLPRDPNQALAAGILMLPANRKTQGILGVRPVGENLAISALRNVVGRGGIIRTKLRERLIDEMMHRFAVRPSDSSREINSLSGGNQQKALFARATAAHAEILILDQPTAGVDVGATVELYDQVDALTGNGVAVLLISDVLTELLRLSDTIILMRNGVATPARPSGDYNRATLLAAITGTESNVNGAGESQSTEGRDSSEVEHLS